MLKTHCTIIFIFLVSLGLNAQSYEERFNQIFRNDTLPLESARPILKAWRSGQPENAEMFIAHSNFFFTLAQEEYMQLTPEPPADGEQALEIKDDEGNVEGYLRTVQGYNDSVAAIAINFLDQALEIHPRRLDIWFGKCYTLREVGRYEEHVDVLKQVLEMNAKDGSWLWANGIPFEQSALEFSEIIHEYCAALAVSTAAPGELVFQTIETAISYFPQNIFIFNDLGVAHYYRGDNQAAIGAFKRALAIDEDNMTCIGNIAYLYLEEGNLEESRSYYERMLKSSNPDDVAVAQEQLNYIQNIQGE